MGRRHPRHRELFALVGLYLLLNGTAAVPLAHAIRYDAEPDRVLRTVRPSYRPRHGPAPKTTPAFTAPDEVHGVYGPEAFRDSLLILVEPLQVYGPQQRPGEELLFRTPVAQAGQGSQPAAMPQGP